MYVPRTISLLFGVLCVNNAKRSLFASVDGWFLFVGHCVQIPPSLLQVGEYVIPAGAQLILSYELTHCGDRTCGVEGDADFRHCQITAEAFRPERWLDPATRPLEYMPFAQGPKMCVGQHFAMKQMIVSER